MPDPAQSSRAQRMRATLQQAFAPAELDVIDDSARHAGHAGAAPGGQTHFTIRLTTDAFAGMSRVARSRAVYEALAEEFASGLHALSLVLRHPHEKSGLTGETPSQQRVGWST